MNLLALMLGLLTTTALTGYHAGDHRYAGAPNATTTIDDRYLPNAPAGAVWRQD